MQANSVIELLVNTFFKQRTELKKKISILKSQLRTAQAIIRDKDATIVSLREKIRQYKGFRDE